MNQNFSLSWKKFEGRTFSLMLFNHPWMCSEFCASHEKFVWCTNDVETSIKRMLKSTFSSSSLSTYRYSTLSFYHENSYFHVSSSPCPHSFFSSKVNRDEGELLSKKLCYNRQWKNVKLSRKSYFQSIFPSTCVAEKKVEFNYVWKRKSENLSSFSVGVCSCFIEYVRDWVRGFERRWLNLSHIIIP